MTQLHFLYFFVLLVLPVALQARAAIYTVGSGVRDEHELYAFAELHHYRVEPLYPWPSKHYVVDDSGAAAHEASHIQSRALALGHKLHEPGNYKRRRDVDYGLRDALPYTDVENNFYFPGPSSLHSLHYGLAALPPTVNGSGVQVYIPDGGFQCDHAAFSRNGVAGAACDARQGFDVCGDGRNTLPYDFTDYHGTMCASVVCAGATTYGGGIAPGATCVPRRYICGTREWTVIDEARGNAVDHPAVLSVSNGPPDFMMYYEFPPQPLLDGIVESWQRGLIRVDAIGNGHQVGDHATFDWTTCLRQTLAIAAISASGLKEEYSEVGPNAFMSGFGAGGSNYIYTAFPSPTKRDLTNIFDGTSAAAPQYAGIAALLLGANRALDQRNMVAILVKAAERHAIIDYDFPFDQNAAGYWHSPAFGFGVVNMTTALALATDPQWAPIPAERECRATVLASTIRADDAFTRIEVSLAHCDLHFVEFVNLRLTCLLDSSSSITGISLISPSGTEGVFLDAGHLYRLQNLDFFSGGWAWYGEEAAGTWVFELSTLDDFEVSVASLFVYGY